MKSLTFTNLYPTLFIVLFNNKLYKESFIASFCNIWFPLLLLSTFPIHMSFTASALMIIIYLIFSLLIGLNSKRYGYLVETMDSISIIPGMSKLYYANEILHKYKIYTTIENIKNIHH